MEKVRPEDWDVVSQGTPTACYKPPSSRSVTLVTNVVQSFFSSAQWLAARCAEAAVAVLTNDPAEVLIQKLKKVTYPYQDEEYVSLLDSLKDAICSDSGDSSKMILLATFVESFIKIIRLVHTKLEGNNKLEMNRKMFNIYFDLSTYLSCLKDVRLEKKAEVCELLLTLTHLFE